MQASPVVLHEIIWQSFTMHAKPSIYFHTRTNVLISTCEKNSDCNLVVFNVATAMGDAGVWGYFSFHNDVMT